MVGACGVFWSAIVSILACMILMVDVLQLCYEFVDPLIDALFDR